MTVNLEIANHVATVTIDRPDVLNAIDEAAEKELQRIWASIEANNDVWCVVLTGAGEKAFCVGADVHSAAASGKSGVDYWMDTRVGGFGGIAVRNTLNVPVIGRVNGYALGGGFEMVLGCDIVVAVDGAKFGLPEPRIGFMPLDGGMVTLPRQIGMKAAMGILLTGRRLDAQEALALGMINEIATSDALDDTVQKWVDQILACSPLAVRAIKQTVKTTAHLPLDQAMGMRHPALADALYSEDREEGVQAFQEKRAPRWRGQ